MGRDLTKAQRVLLQIAISLGGTIRVFPDQFSTATALEARGLLVGNGQYLDRRATITPAGRAALDRTTEER